ncbi:2-C-methyl-D-erythritol 4-phosphate cytidylyltransferase [Nemorincola caseinilytica]|uniref:2-C-methyl-D-erythritol 4-phosphate cytidylyltransferase n=1 Tax=Nemorincola caseinilytica TaxID=2054315 RepID=A0ABP8NL52_9BACT
MSNTIKKYAIIVAGGKGVRMASSIPKQFMPLMGIPVLCHSVLAFSHAFPDIRIILVTPADQVNGVHTILKSYIGDRQVTCVAGGETRFHSVQSGLKAIKNDGVVFVHDGVRPLVSQELIYRCYESALDHGSAIPVMPVTDSMRLVDEDGDSHPVNRDNLRIVQTPQTFMSHLILPAFDRPYDPAFTDEATVVEAHGHRVRLVAGDRDNIKITTPGDMVIAETLLKTSS